MEQELICSTCETKGDIVALQRKNDMLVCPKCGSSWFIEGESPLKRYQETWNDTSGFLFAILRPELPGNVILEPGLKGLYEDCYQTLLIGRYNASIVMMGVFLEALMKERIRLKTGKDFRKPYGECIDRLMGIKRLRKGGIERIERAGDGYNLIAIEDILFLHRFRDKVRNTYAHFDEAKVVDNQIMQVWEIPLDGGLILPKLETAVKEVKAGKHKPLLIHATHSTFNLKNGH